MPRTLSLCCLALTLAAGCTSEPEARWWKGNTHTHTLWSDGDAAPELVADWYAGEGYHFLVLSDHNVLSEGDAWFPVLDAPTSRLTPERVEELKDRFGADWVQLRTRDSLMQMRLKTLSEVRALYEQPGAFLFIQGEEISDGFEDRPIHLNGINLAEPIEPQGGASVQEVLQRNLDAVAEQGRRLDRPVLGHINHPNFGWGLTPEEVAAVRGERFFEVYNGHSYVRNYGDENHPGMEELWDIALTLRLTDLDLGVLYGLATDDAHAYFATGLGNPNPGRGWVMVRAPELTAEAILAALQSGDFYASSGVTLRDIRSDSRGLTVEIDAEPSVAYRTTFIGTRRTEDGAGPIGEVLAESTGHTASYTLSGDELYVRARVVSSRPHPNPYQEGDVETAWVQPVIPGR